MKCPKCQTENPETRKFCRECGAKLAAVCPECGLENLLGDKFCGECGHSLIEGEALKKAPPVEQGGERKYVTALFSDLSGYTAMSERLDPEEVKEITGTILGEIAKIIDRYDGFVEKYAGDAVMALFGVPEAHEDDALRAIRAALEIHNLVKAKSTQLEEKIGRPLSMHTGINTGLVVTGEVNLEKGTHGVAGDTINVAARLSSLAEADRIVVGRATYRQAEGYFDFEETGPVVVKGREKPVQSYKVVCLREKPVTLHRLSGLKADLIGRKAELAELREAFELLKEGKGRVFSICGDAGTGKSRLVQEFRESLNLSEIQWLEAHAYAYTQNVPYYPLVDLFSRTFEIEEGDRPERIKEKIECSLNLLIGDREDLIPYVGSLYSLHYPEVEEVSPEFWKGSLREAVKCILSALVLRGPTVLFLEDLHWADPSFVELLRTTLQEAQHPAIVLCVYRPGFNLFTSHQMEGFRDFYREIRLQELSASEAMDMLVSLLQTDNVPAELRRFVNDKAEGNPFYLEELVNSLIESDTLVKDNETWKLTGPITESSVSSTIHGIISGRLDRLQRETKRVLQEASVIGRSFLYDILKRISELQDQVDRCLIGLERLDLIRTKSLVPDLEYIFKHALTQEVVYNGLLKKERREIHERIGRVMEQLFEDRLSEFYETLAYHYAHGQSLLKAVDYLTKSGEKSLKRFALEEAHAYYKQAFDLLKDKTEKSEMENRFLLDLIVKWALVYNHKGDFKGLNELLLQFEELAESLGDKSKLGMYYAWLGFTVWIRGKARDGFSYLSRALTLGEDTEDFLVIAYACTWLTWACWDLGLLEEGVRYGERAQELQRKYFPENHYIHFSSLGGVGHICSATGESKKALEIGQRHIDYGQKHSDVRSTVFGYIDLGFGYFIAGDFPKAVDCFQQAVQISPDPFFAMYAQFWLGASYLMENRVEEAEAQLRDVLKFAYAYGTELFEHSTIGFLGVVSILKGRLSEGLRMIEQGVSGHFREDRRSLHALMEHTLGKVYLQIAQGEGPKSLSFMIKNIGFLVRNVPLSKRKAEEHLKTAIEISREIGANYTLGLALMDLGILNRIKKRPNEAQRNLTEAAQLFKNCGAHEFRKQAEKVIASL